MVALPQVAMAHGPDNKGDGKGKVKGKPAWQYIHYHVLKSRLCRFRMQGHGRRCRHDHNRHVEVALVATEAMAATDAMAGIIMELVDAVAVGMNLVGLELVVGLELAAAVGADKSQMTCTEAARGVVQ